MGKRDQVIEKVTTHQMWVFEYREPGGVYPWKWHRSMTPPQYTLKDARKILHGLNEGKNVRRGEHCGGNGLLYRCVHQKTTEKPIYD